MKTEPPLSPADLTAPWWRRAKSSETDLRYEFAALMRVQAMWFFLAAFPSFVLVYSHGSCVSFQGIAPWIDFAAIQAMFVASSLGLISPRLLDREWFLRYHRIVVIINMVVLAIAMIVHARGLVFHGAGFKTSCFNVDLGGVWYLLGANLGGGVLYFSQLLIVSALIRRRSQLSVRPGNRARQT